VTRVDLLALDEEVTGVSPRGNRRDTSARRPGISETCEPPSQTAVLRSPVAIGLAPRTTAAHFVLHAPASWRAQGSLGDPQKTGPCGNEDTAATTGVVTAFSPGETVTITIDETVFHPGHYRVALAVHDRDELPAEPQVHPGTTECGSADVLSPPVFPILADGVLQHALPFSDLQSFTVTLPSDVTCDHCTLQVSRSWRTTARASTTTAPTSRHSQ
jgi:hypothetical protein